MHAYPDGCTGLAAFCDTCGDQITEHGYVVWNQHGGVVTEWRVIHQGRCDYPYFKCSMPLDAEWIYLANSAGVDIARAMKRMELPA